MKKFISAKRFISALLCTVLIFAFLPSFGFAENGESLEFEKNVSLLNLAGVVSQTSFSDAELLANVSRADGHAEPPPEVVPPRHTVRPGIVPNQNMAGLNGIKVNMYKKSRSNPAAPRRVSGRTNGPLGSAGGTTCANPRAISFHLLSKESLYDGKYAGSSVARQKGHSRGNGARPPAPAARLGAGCGGLVRHLRV